MDKEEKKAVDYLKNDVVYWLDKGKDFVVIDIGENEKLHSILNLIDKQQKEIEKKNSLIDVLQHRIEEFLDNKKEIIYIKPIDIPVHNYISEDKIRERIKKAKEIKWHTPKLVIEYFEELLEEN